MIRRIGPILLFVALVALAVPAIGGEAVPAPAGSGCPYSGKAEAAEPGAGCPYSGGKDVAEAAPGCPYSGKTDDAVAGCPYSGGRDRVEAKSDGGCPYLAGDVDGTPIDPVRERNKT